MTPVFSKVDVNNGEVPSTPAGLLLDTLDDLSEGWRVGDSHNNVTSPRFAAKHDCLAIIDYFQKRGIRTFEEYMELESEEILEALAVCMRW